MKVLSTTLEITLLNKRIRDSLKENVSTLGVYDNMMCFAIGNLKNDFSIFAQKITILHATSKLYILKKTKLRI
jgi:hypothetical protein